ncbi:hypothetical protein IGI04_023662 [Brassica rapa subsp. trilocularis]|uniref:Uncharacterized protein n=1 Tax=Brassica rapa subsp. trilocularis TaxID=1813537 RepID=A0ABQ7M4J1_BRACM|nr:hypothetical protein IGI04_023662 [Brassica rapa subsp. trilocularis]
MTSSGRGALDVLRSDRWSGDILHIYITCLSCILHTYISIRYLSTTWSFWRHLGAFGAQKGVFRVVIGRARHGATSPERHHQVALTSLLERPYQSDREKSLAVSSLGDARTSPERPPGATPRSRSHLTPLSERPPKATPEVARVSMARRHEAKPGATSQSDPLRSLPKAGATCRSDMPRLKVDSLIDHLPSLVRYLITQGQEELCFINNNGSWYKKELNFQYNNYQQKSYPNNQQSGYPPRNNQQDSYQPQQNPSSGSSAPQESSTDTLLKQILESQTRSEKQVGYELKNLHSKIDGSYNELNNKFSHLASTSLKPTTTLFELNELNASCSCFWRHLGAFGAQKGVFRVVIGRARHGATSPERHHQVALTSLLERPYPSDREKSLAVSSLGDARTSPERPPGATPRSRSHLTPLSERPPKATPRGRSRLYGETTRSEAWSDLSERPTEVAPEGRSDLSERHAEPPEEIIFDLLSIEKYTRTLLRSSSFGSILDHPRSNPYAHEFSFPLVKKCFDIPQNWFDNHLYYNICLRAYAMVDSFLESLPLF